MTSRRPDLLLHIPIFMLWAGDPSQSCIVMLFPRMSHWGHVFCMQMDVCMCGSFTLHFFFFTKHLFLFSHSRLNKDCWVLVALSLSERGQRITALLCRLQGFCLPSSTSSVTGCLLLQETRPSLLKGTQNQVTRDGGQLGLCKKCPQVILGVLWSDGNVLTAEDIRR